MQTVFAACTKRFQRMLVFLRIFKVVNYNEYLPAILNTETMEEYDLQLKKSGYRRSYQKSINPTIANEFAAAAFR